MTPSKAAMKAARRLVYEPMPEKCDMDKLVVIAATALDSFRAAALEDAARLCESVRDGNYTATQSCAAAIRALKGTP